MDNNEKKIYGLQSDKLEDWPAPDPNKLIALEIAKKLGKMVVFEEAEDVD